MKKIPPLVSHLFIQLFAGLCLFGGFYLIHWQKQGTPTTATVTRCTRARRSHVCNGTWMVNGKFHMGTIENANLGDLGQRIEVRYVEGDERAIKPGLRLPIIFFVLGAGVSGLGIYQWIREAPRGRTG